MERKISVIDTDQPVKNHMAIFFYFFIFVTVYISILQTIKTYLMKAILTVSFLALSIFSCSQQTPEVHKVNPSSKTHEKKQKLANTIDPICQMKVHASAKDTAFYKGKTYGFCNPYCKQEFKKNPKKYTP